MSYELMALLILLALPVVSAIGLVAFVWHGEKCS
jgi:hypothetical protein